MDEHGGLAVWFLGVTIMTHMVVMFFKTPKEVNTELVSRLVRVEENHRGLEREFIKSHATLGTKLDNLTEGVANLYSAVKELTKRMDGYRG